MDSIYSTKQVDRKTMRHIIYNMKDSVNEGKVEKYIWTNTKNMIADILTKDSAPTYWTAGSSATRKEEKNRTEQGKIDILRFRSSRTNPRELSLYIYVTAIGS